MDSLLDFTQTAYIKGTYIMDNVVCAHEILHTVRKKKIKGVLFKIDFEKAFDRVNWDFLFEVLESRGFGLKWLTWITKLFEGSKTCINFNGQLSEYFRFKRGVRQGDPLSPFLFDIVADVLNRIIKNAHNKGHLHGLDRENTMGSILNLHFADDTLLFLDAAPQNIEILKWLLIGFEDLSGMKINFAKCELIPLNIPSDEGSFLASQLGCKLGTSPITYLGVLLH